MTVLNTCYRFGTTSYIWPDDILPNVRKLATLVDDVELVLFDLDDHSNFPDAETVGELNKVAEVHDLTYTIHLPLDLALAHPLTLEKAERAIACTYDLSPWAYVLHLDGRAVEGVPNPLALARWQDDAVRILERIVSLVAEPQQLCVENLENYAPECYVPLLERVPVRLCVDVGHLWLTDRDPATFLDEYLAHTRVVHLHGILEGQDHKSLTNQGPGQVAPVLELLSNRGFDGVVTLEVFRRAHFYSSRALITEVLYGQG